MNPRSLHSSSSFLPLRYVASVFKQKPLQTLGEWSYGTYIVQAPVMFYLLWALHAREREIGEIFNMILAKALGELDPACPTLPDWSLPLVLVLCHVLGGLVTEFVEKPMCKYLAPNPRAR